MWIMLTYQYNIYDNSTQSFLLKSIKMICSLFPKYILYTFLVWYAGHEKCCFCFL